MSNDVYAGWDKIRGGDYGADEWQRSRKDQRIRDLTQQVDALAAECAALRAELVRAREAAA